MGTFAHAGETGHADAIVGVEPVVDQIAKFGGAFKQSHQRKELEELCEQICEWFRLWHVTGRSARTRVVAGLV